MSVKKILVVEDSKMDQVLIENALKDIGEVEIRDNPVEATFILGNAPDHYSAVILDQNFPAGFTGRMMEKFVKSLGLPCVFYTAADNFHSDLFPVLQKDGNLKNLREMLSSMIDHPSEAHA